MAKQAIHQFTLLKPAEKRHTEQHRSPRSKLAQTQVYQEAVTWLNEAERNKVGPYEIGFVIDLKDPEIKKELSVLKNPKLSLTFTLRMLLKTRNLVKQLRVNLLADKLHPLLDKLGIPRMGFHAFRHASASVLDRMNAPMKVRQQRLGHSNASITLGIYTHSNDDDSRQVAAQFDDIFAPHCPSNGYVAETNGDGEVKS